MVGSGPPSSTSYWGQVTGSSASPAPTARRRRTRAPGGHGATALRADRHDRDPFRTGAAHPEPGAHPANTHDWGNPAESNRAERAAVEALGEALPGTDRPFLVASGVAGLAQGRLADVLSEENLSRCFGLRLSLERRDGRYLAWS